MMRLREAGLRQRFAGKNSLDLARERRIIMLAGRKEEQHVELFAGVGD